MGHDEHFLQRLDRLSDAHLETALMLYRAPEIVRDAISSAGIGPHVERVLLALDEQALGARVLVARDGAFVTCLSDGMASGPWPRVTRASLDVSIGRFTRSKQLNDEIEKHTLPEWTAKFQRLSDAGPWMTREEMASMRVIADVMPMQNVAMLIKLADVWRKLREEIVRVPEGGSLPDERLKTIWRVYWSLLHHATLCAMSASTIWSIVAETDAISEDKRLESMLALMIAPAASSTLAGLSRGVQFVLRGGKPAFRTAKRAAAATDSLPWRELAVATVALVAHGHNQTKVGVEAEKAVRLAKDRHEEIARDPELALSTLEFQRYFASIVLDRLRQAPDRGEAFARDIAWSTLANEQRAQFESAQAIPEELVAPLVASSRCDYRQGDNFLYALFASPWVSKAKPEEFYFPAAHKKLAYGRYIDDGEWVWSLAHAAAEYHPPREKKTVALGRNALCSCGSGKKYKRCCGA